MAKETSARRMVYAATGLVVGVTLLWAFVFVPRLAVHPQAIADRVDSSSKIFFLIQLVATVILLVFVVVSRLGGRMTRELLYLAESLFFCMISWCLSGPYIIWNRTRDFVHYRS